MNRVDTNHLNALPEAMRESVRLVERTREDRLARSLRGETYPSLSISDRKAWLDDFHPDQRVDGKRSLLVGPDEGNQVPVELADLLESRPRIALTKLMKDPSNHCKS